MSDSNLTTQRQILDLQDTLEPLRKADVPALYLPWAQRVLNPFPLASSATQWGTSPQPWTCTVLAWNVSVYVLTTNDGTNFWTLTLRDEASSTLATLNTSAISANDGVRLSTTTITAPASSSAYFEIIATATLGLPGAIYIIPSLALLRTGN